MVDQDAVERALRLARGELSAPDAALERVWRRLPADVCAGTAPGPLRSGAVQRAGRGTLRATGFRGFVAGAVLAGSGFIAGFWARGHVPSAADGEPAPSGAALASTGSPASAPLAAETAPSGPRAEPPVEAPALAAELVPRSSGARAALVPSLAAKPRSTPRERQPLPEPESAFDPRQELALLARVERALRNEDAPLALALLGDLDRRFPETELTEERLAARLMAYCVQRRAGAEAAAREFLREHPASVYASRLRSVCAFEAAPAGAHNRDAELTERPAPDTNRP